MIDTGRPNVVAHELAGEELLTPFALADAATRLDPAHVQHHLGNLPTVSPEGHARRLPLTTSEVLRGLDTNGCWVMMRRLAALPEYGALMRHHVRAFDLSLRARGEVPIGHDLIAFVAAPGATVPVHYDRDHHLLAQVSGTKLVGAGAFRQEDEQRRQVARGFYEERVNADAFPDDADTYVLGPGDALVLPAYTFHWVTVGDDVSVAMTFAITTEATRRAVDEHRRDVRGGAVTGNR
ncbi:MAG TPA: cupin domain-containing protein [Acidimicrobiia bacterium]|nr:cupin domain-containing protein [Acidimicrobiia bacterium]